MGLLTSFTNPSGERRTYLETVTHNDGASAGTISQNFHYLQRPADVVMLDAPMTLTTAKVYNGATANGNWAADVWISYDLSTATKLGTTGSVAQSGTNTVQSAALTSTIVVPPFVYVFLGFSADSATGTYLRVTTWTGANNIKAKSTLTSASFNPAGPITLNTNGAATFVWVEVS